MARKKIHLSNDQPAWTCHACGMKYGSFRAGIATWHQDTCGACGKKTSCTEPRDYGYYLAGWKDKKAGVEIKLGEKPDG